MTRVAKVEIENWDPDLRAMTRADEATPLEQGLMRIFANVPELAKAFVGFGGAMKRTRTLSPRLVERALPWFTQTRSGCGMDLQWARTWRASWGR